MLSIIIDYRFCLNYFSVLGFKMDNLYQAIAEHETPQYTQILQYVCDVFNQFPFLIHNQLYMRVVDEQLQLYTEMQPHLVGNMHFQILHGGVTATILDTIGGALAIAELFHKTPSHERDKIAHKASRLATLDMRVDYISPGRGAYFIATAEAVRIGRKSSTIRMNLHNDQQKLIATAIASYSF